MASYPADTRPVEMPTWRTRDIVVTAVIGVAFGVAFVAFNTSWEVIAFLGHARYILYAWWLLPAIIAPAIVRKPGAAIFAEMTAAGLSTFIGGTPWGPDTLLSGFVQGAAAELVFALTLYRRWSWPVLAAASLASAAAAFVHDWAVYFPTFSPDSLLLIAVLMAVSAVVLLPTAAILLIRALREAGVLEGFPA